MWPENVQFILENCPPSLPDNQFMGDPVTCESAMKIMTFLPNDDRLLVVVTRKAIISGCTSKNWPGLDAAPTIPLKMLSLTEIEMRALCDHFTCFETGPDWWNYCKIRLPWNSNWSGSSSSSLHLVVTLILISISCTRIVLKWQKRPISNWLTCNTWLVSLLPKLAAITTWRTW